MGSASKAEPSSFLAGTGALLDRPLLKGSKFDRGHTSIELSLPPAAQLPLQASDHLPANVPPSLVVPRDEQLAFPRWALWPAASIASSVYSW